MSRKPHNKSNRMQVSITAPQAERVHIAGDFNNWDPRATPMRRQRDSRWVAVVDLPPGLHEYKFVVDGRWCCEDGCDPAFDGRPGHVPNLFGTMNIVIQVPSLHERDLVGLIDR